MRPLCKIFDTLKVDEESYADNQSHWVKKCAGVIPVCR